MHKLLKKFYNRRKTNKKLGSLGDCKFLPINVFLQTFASKNNFVDKLHTNNQRVVAIGDIHSDFLALLSTLYMMNCINAEGKWIARNTIVVQMGDFMDREGREDQNGHVVGTNTYNNIREEVDIIQYMYSLHKQALKKNSRVIMLLGNHELGNIYPNIEEFQGFERYQGTFQLSGWGGIENKLKIFEPGGTMATFMSNNYPLCLQIDNFLYVHGDINIKMLKKINANNVQQMNKLMRSCLLKQCVSNTNFRLILDIVNGRSLAFSINEHKCSNLVDKIFKRFKLNLKRGGIVVGHTPQNEISPICFNRVWRIDIALSEAFGNTSKTGALEIYTTRKCTFVNILEFSATTTTRKLYVNGKLVMSSNAFFEYHRIMQKNDIHKANG
jgi:hypothetical protein